MTPNEFIQKYKSDLEVSKRMLDENALFYTPEQKLKAAGRILVMNAMLMDFGRVMDNLFEQIKHGDQEHQEWLKNKLNGTL